MSSTAAAAFDRLQEFRDDFAARFGAQIAFAVDADANGVGFHVAFSDYVFTMISRPTYDARRPSDFCHWSSQANARRLFRFGNQPRLHRATYRNQF